MGHLRVMRMMMAVVRSELGMRVLILVVRIRIGMHT